MSNEYKDISTFPVLDKYENILEKTRHENLSEDEIFTLIKVFRTIILTEIKPMEIENLFYKNNGLEIHGMASIDKYLLQFFDQKSFYQSLFKRVLADNPRLK